jgi:UDP-glucuronate 4-epimerase
MQKILVTGFGGFVGYSLVQRMRSTYTLVALDNFTKFSNYEIKLSRAKDLGIEDFEAFETSGHCSANGVDFYKADICITQDLEKIFAQHKFDAVVHLAALTGVRPSLQFPEAYITNNILGFSNVLEAAHKHGVKNIIYASSSSVYGANTATPYNEEQRTDSPISAYAASKKANELLAEVHVHLYGTNITGLRFFTVYGPWTRPDMAAYIFMKAIAEQQPIQLFDSGKMLRDFTYIDDVTKSIAALLEKNTEDTIAAHRVFNIGNHQPIFTIDFLKKIEDAMQQKAVVEFREMQAGDMPSTYADSSKLQDYLGFAPATNIETGIAAMVQWFRNYYRP